VNARGGSPLSEASNLVVIPTPPPIGGGGGATTPPPVTLPPGPAIDRVAPQLATRTPGPGDVGVGRRRNVVVTFTERVLGVGGQTFQVRTVADIRVPATVTLSADGRTATLNPAARLAPDTRYRVTITGGASNVRDVAGNGLLSTAWRFTTRR